MRAATADFDLLLDGSDETTARLAQHVLDEAGIPSLIAERPSETIYHAYGLRSPDARVDLFVPKGERERAASLLRETWDRDALTDEIALSATGESPAVAGPRAKLGPWGWLVFVAIVLIVVLTYAADFF